MDSDTSDSEQVITVRKGRKRLRRVQNWVKKKRKVKKDSGKPYKTYKGEIKLVKRLNDFFVVLVKISALLYSTWTTESTYLMTFTS